MHIALIDMILLGLIYKTKPTLNDQYLLNQLLQIYQNVWQECALQTVLHCNLMLHS